MDPLEALRFLSGSSSPGQIGGAGGGSAAEDGRPDHFGTPEAGSAGIDGVAAPSQLDDDAEQRWALSFLSRGQEDSGWRRVVREEKE